MKAYAYKTSKSDTFLLLSRHQDFRSLPKATKANLGELTYWKEIDILPGQPLIGIPERTAEVLRDSGYLIVHSKLDASERVFKEGAS